MNRSNTPKAARVCAVPAFLMLTNGCADFFPPPPDDLSPELAFVVENREQFLSDLDDPLFDLAAGTVIDDMSGLDGCWASAVVSDVVLGDRPLVAFYTVFRFDVHQGKYTSWLFSDQAFTITANVVGAGSLSLDGDNNIVTDGAESGEIRTTQGVETSEGTVVRQALATLSGDRLRLHFGQADQDPSYPGDDELYWRFACLE